jgi:hypothetical protein
VGKEVGVFFQPQRSLPIKTINLLMGYAKFADPGVETLIIHFVRAKILCRDTHHIRLDPQIEVFSKKDDPTFLSFLKRVGKGDHSVIVLHRIPARGTVGHLLMIQLNPELPSLR